MSKVYWTRTGYISEKENVAKERELWQDKEPTRINIATFTKRYALTINNSLPFLFFYYPHFYVRHSPNMKKGREKRIHDFILNLLLSNSVSRFYKIVYFFLFVISSFSFLLVLLKYFSGLNFPYKL